jgi:hypothetical protein
VILRGLAGITADMVESAGLVKRLSFATTVTDIAVNT